MDQFKKLWNEKWSRSLLYTHTDQIQKIIGINRAKKKLGGGKVASLDSKKFAKVQAKSNLG